MVRIQANFNSNMFSITPDHNSHDHWACVETRIWENTKQFNNVNTQENAIERQMFSPYGTDIVFSCIGGKKAYAHSLILNQIPYMKNILESARKVQDGFGQTVLILPDVEVSNIIMCLDWIYNRRIIDDRNANTFDINSKTLKEIFGIEIKSSKVDVLSQDQETQTDIVCGSNEDDSIRTLKEQAMNGSSCFDSKSTKERKTENDSSNGLCVNCKKAECIVKDGENPKMLCLKCKDISLWLDHSSSSDHKCSTPITEDVSREPSLTTAEKNVSLGLKCMSPTNQNQEEKTIEKEKVSESKKLSADTTTTSMDSSSSTSSFFAKIRGKHQFYEMEDTELKSGSWSNAFMGSHGDPSYFFIIPECSKQHSEKLQDILNEMDNFYENVDQGLNRKNFKISDPHKGQPCAVREYGKYSRGKIIETVYEGQETVKVFLVDEGDVTECSIENIRLIPKHYLDVHMMSIPTKLTGIKPSSQDGNWSLECLNYFKTMFTSKFTLYMDKRSTVPAGQRIKHSGLPSRKNISSVTLYRNEEINGKKEKISINSELVAMGYAEIESSEPGCLSEVSYYSNIREYAIAEVDVHQNPIKSTDRECIILSAYEPNYWYVRLKGSQLDLTFDKGKLKLMLHEMNHFYIAKYSARFKRLETIVEVENEDSEGSGWEPLYMNFKPGHFVALKHEQDGVWKRGKVIQVYDHQSKTDVLLIDEGIIVFGIPIENLSNLEDRYMLMTSDVYCVQLADVNDIILKRFELTSNVVEELTKEDNLFETQTFVRFDEGPHYAKNEIVDVTRTSAVHTYPVRMILRGHKGTRDPFGHSILYQKDVSIYLMEKGLATNLYQWEDPVS